MRTLRLSLVGTVILVLLGGVGSLVAAQEAAGGVYVTGTIQCDEAPGRTVQEDDAVELHLFSGQCVSVMSDPRLSGAAKSETEQFCLKDPRGHICMLWGATEIDGPDGTWVGTYGSVADEARTGLPGWGVMEGTGAYEGWTYWFHVPDFMDPSGTAAGILYEGPPPPWGTTLPLTPAE